MVVPDDEEKRNACQGQSVTKRYMNSAKPPVGGQTGLALQLRPKPFSLDINLILTPAMGNVAVDTP